MTPRKAPWTGISNTYHPLLLLDEIRSNFQATTTKRLCRPTKRGHTVLQISSYHAPPGKPKATQELHSCKTPLFVARAAPCTHDKLLSGSPEGRRNRTNQHAQPEVYGVFSMFAQGDSRSYIGELGRDRTDFSLVLAPTAHERAVVESAH
jgi:hypothetical protein